MIEYETKLKSWGNSIGLIIPKEELLKEKLTVDQNVKAIILPANTLKVKDIFAKIKLTKTTNKLLKEVDKEIDTKF